MIQYTDLKTYCDRENITYQDFGVMVSPDSGVSWVSIYRVITGRQQSPSKKTRKVLDGFIRRNRAKILKAIGKNEDLAAGMAPADGEKRNLVIVHGVMSAGTMVRSVGSN